MNLVFLWWSTSKVSVSFVSRTFFIYILIGINASPRLHSLTIETFPTEDGTPYNGLYGGGGGGGGATRKGHFTFFRPRVYNRVRISLVEVCKRVNKSPIAIWKITQRG